MNNSLAPFAKRPGLLRSDATILAHDMALPLSQCIWITPHASMIVIQNTCDKVNCFRHNVENMVGNLPNYGKIGENGTLSKNNLSER